MTIIADPQGVSAGLVEETTARFEQRASERSVTEHKIDEVKAGSASVLEVDSPERVQMRADRVAAHDPQETLSQAPPEAVPEALERIIEGSNLLGVAFLELGSQVAGTVGRINIRNQVQLRGFGTGFMVSPRLLMTNNHVLPDAASARFSNVEFDLQNNLDGKPRETHAFDLLPDEVFLTDKALDVSVVAVAERSREAGTAQRELASYGFNRLSREQGKILLGESINIIQHPSGEPKQLALQQNELVDRFETFLHYRSDTSPGSSGSPLFNNQWEILGLHHSGVPAKDDQGRILATDGSVWTQAMGNDKVKWVANEGIRISSVIAWLESQQPTLPAAGQALVQAVVTPAPIESAAAPVAVPAPREPVGAQLTAEVPSVQTPAAATLIADAGREVTITIPVQVTVRLGAADVSDPGVTLLADVEEAVSIDPDYSTRGGYDPDFLGFPVPLPRLTPAQRAAVVVVAQPRPDRDEAVLDYHHYSLVMHRARRLAWYTVVNIDGSITRDLTRETDKWIFDPRIPRDTQLGKDIYTKNDFDRGHLVRRIDPAWGPDDQVAKVANDDTFHFTNCSPQHAKFNQGDALWAGLEDHVLREAKAEKKRITVFNGPVFRDDDPVHRGAQIPLAFWKIMVFRTPEGEGSASAFLISQKDLVDGMNLEASFVPETFQVPVRSITELTTLDFEHLRAVDALDAEDHESVEESTGVAAPGVRLSSYGDLRL